MEQREEKGKESDEGEGTTSEKKNEKDSESK